MTKLKERDLERMADSGVRFLFPDDDRKFIYNPKNDEFVSEDCAGCIRTKKEFAIVECLDG